MTKRTLFIADLHFNHKRIHDKFRPQFSSDEEHDDFIHNSIIDAGDTNTSLWLLGDTFFNPKGFWRLDEFRKAYQQVNIVLGNHCSTQLPRYALQFKNVNVFGVQQRYGLWLSHIPVMQQEMYRVQGCVSGHLHSNNVLGEKGEIDNRYYIVSCEQVDYRPISLEQIKEERGWK